MPQHKNYGILFLNAKKLLILHLVALTKKISEILP